MFEETKSKGRELREHEAFLRLIDDLNSTLTRGRGATVTQIVVVSLAIVAALLLGSPLFDSRPTLAFIVDSVLSILLACNVYELLQHNRLKEVRSSLLDQLQIAIKQRALAAELYDLSILDSLTGLHNRRFGEERLRQEMLRADRNGEPLTVVLCDLDYFKQINDQFGHAAGDLALKEFSRTMMSAVRACDLPVRIGGDEFLIILPECPKEKVNRILYRIGAPGFEFNSQRISIGYSVGHAHYGPNDTIESLLGRADAALYAEKQKRSKNTITGDPPHGPKWPLLAGRRISTKAN